MASDPEYRAGKPELVDSPAKAFRHLLAQHHTLIEALVREGCLNARRARELLAEVQHIQRDFEARLALRREKG